MFVCFYKFLCDCVFVLQMFLVTLIGVKMLFSYKMWNILDVMILVFFLCADMYVQMQAGSCLLEPGWPE